MVDIAIEQLGKLSQHPHVPEWLVSGPIPIPFFEMMEMEFVFDDELETGTADFVEKSAAVSRFLLLDSFARLQATPLILQNYEQVQERYDSLDAVQSFIYLHMDDDIWTHVYPSEIIVSRRHRRDQDVYIQVHCECEWEPEHGLQLVFRQGSQLTRVGDIDGHLTQSDAVDSADSDDELLSKFTSNK